MIVTVGVLDVVALPANFCKMIVTVALLAFLYIFFLYTQDSVLSLWDVLHTVHTPPLFCLHKMVVCLSLGAVVASVLLDVRNLPSDSHRLGLLSSDIVNPANFHLLLKGQFFLFKQLSSHSVVIYSCHNMISQHAFPEHTKLTVLCQLSKC